MVEEVGIPEKDNSRAMNLLSLCTQVSDLVLKNEAVLGHLFSVINPKISGWLWMV